MPHRFFALLLLACSWPLATGATTELDGSQQCVVVLTDNWASTTGKMHLFERAGSTAPWQEQGSGFSVVGGKKGLGLGRGLVDLTFDGAPEKKEGDNRVPAGIFNLPSAFGYAEASSATWIKLPYLPLSKQVEGVDDVNSRHYNKLVDRSKVAKVDWRSSEQMRRDDILYKWGVFVDHNPRAIPGAGSCIFLHIWRGPASPTVGCTAMPEREMLRLLRWLDPERRPILVQMPRTAYHSIRTKYGLPPVP